MMVVNKYYATVGWMLLLSFLASSSFNAVVAFSIARDNKGCCNRKGLRQYTSQFFINGGTASKISPHGCLLANLNNDGPPSSSSNQHHPDEQCGDNGNNGSSNQCKAKKKTPLKLNWNLPALLSCQEDPKDQSKLVLLEDVYNAVNTAIKKNMANRQEEEQQQSGDSLPFQEGSTFKSFEYKGKLATSLAPYRRFVRNYNYDMGHDGRFTVLGSPDETDDTYLNDDGASIQPGVVFMMEDPLSFIRNTLTYQDKTQVSKRNSNNGKYKDDEVVIFANGLHTFHERSAMEGNQRGPKCRKRTSSERVKYYSQVLDGLPMAHIHAGTYLDQVGGGAIDIKLSWDTVRTLQSFGLLLVKEDDGRESRIKSPEGKVFTARKIICSLSANDVDILRTVLSNARDASLDLPKRYVDDKENDNEQLKKTMMKLIDVAVQSVLNSKKSSPSLVLMTYSTTSSILTAALSEWKDIATNSMSTSFNPNSSDVYDAAHRQIFSKQEVELLLHSAITVVTISALSKKFVDGPAYIHLSMHDDILTSSLGVSKDRPEGGGNDAVYIHGISPYERPPMKDDDSGIFAYDAHNMDSCAVQYLSLVRHINGITTFRQLYNLANKETIYDINPSLFAINYHSRKIGDLEMPPDIDEELLPSMIRATGGERWLWNPKLQLGEGGVDGFDSPLPSLSNADASLTNQLGYNIYDEIVKACYVGSTDME